MRRAPWFLLLACAPPPSPPPVTIAPLPTVSSATSASDTPVDDVCAPPELHAMRADAQGHVDRIELDHAVDEAAAFARACCGGGHAGVVHVVIDFPIAGWETSVSLSPSAFDEGDTGTCLHHSFQRIVVGGYRGDAIRIERDVTLR